MATRLSDDELRQALRDFGEDVGPITPTTRSPWERKLTALRRGRGAVPKTNSALNAFSSDDSEIENSSSGSRKKRTHSTRGDSERLSLMHPRETRPDSDIFKKPSAVYTPALSQEKRTHTYIHRTVATRRNKKSPGRNSAFDVETSDSDFDAAESTPKSARLWRKPLSRTFPHPLRNTSDDSNSLFRRKSSNSTLNSEPQQSQSRFSPTFDRLKRDPGSPTYQSNGFLSSSVSNGDFGEDKVVQGSSTNYSHCVSWLLLLGAVAFFILIGALYMTEVQKTSQTVGKNYAKYCTEFNEDNCQFFLFVSRELHELLSNHAGQYECGGAAKNRNLSVSEARNVIRELVKADNSFKMEHFDTVFNHSISLFKRNDIWGVMCHFMSEEKDADVSALEAVKPAKSFWCRVRHSISWTVTKVLIFLTICLLCFLSFMSYKFWKKSREAQEKLFYEMVEKVIDILQDPVDPLHQGEPLAGCCKAVVNVRDALIPAKERKEKLWLWERVVSFIEENESRVSVEFQTINGEDFKVWRWHPCTTAENESGKQGKVWQGQAFSSLGKSKNTYTPTPCLKIRNMFDPEVEYGDEWQVSVRDAILEKCEGNDGIRHIAFDSTNNEGCVYMMCSSEEAAGKAYNDLHGWWFDGKLVTVKYLKKGRYLQRFSEAEHCTEPLRPSNNKRLSLSTPFFSSALERS